MNIPNTVLSCRVYDADGCLYDYISDTQAARSAWAAAHRGKWLMRGNSSGYSLWIDGRQATDKGCRAEVAARLARKPEATRTPRKGVELPVVRKAETQLTSSQEVSVLKCSVGEWLRSTAR